VDCPSPQAADDPLKTGVVERRGLVFTTLFPVLSLVMPAVAQTLEGSDYQGVYDRSNIHVAVDSFSGWGAHGPIVGAYADTTTIRTTLAPDSALEYVDELLAMDFFVNPQRTAPRPAGPSPLETESCPWREKRPKMPAVPGSPCTWAPRHTVSPFTSPPPEHPWP